MVLEHRYMPHRPPRVPTAAPGVAGLRRSGLCWAGLGRPVGTATAGSSGGTVAEEGEEHSSCGAQRRRLAEEPQRQKAVCGRPQKSATRPLATHSLLPGRGAGVGCRACPGPPLPQGLCGRTLTFFSSRMKSSTRVLTCWARAEKRMTFSLARLNSSMFREGMVTNRMSAKLGDRRVRAGPVARGRPLPSHPAPGPRLSHSRTPPAPAQELAQPPALSLHGCRGLSRSLPGPLPLPGAQARGCGPHRPTTVSSVGQG